MAEEVTSLESTEKMTFFESFYRSAMEDLETDGQRLEFYDKLMAYAFDGVAPESDDRMVRMALRMAMPNVRRSAGKRRAGSRGGRGNRAAGPAGGQDPAEPRPPAAAPPEPEADREPEADPERIRAAMIAAGAVWGGRPARESSAKSTPESSGASDMDGDRDGEVDGDLESSSQSCCFPSPPVSSVTCPHCHSRMEPSADGTQLACGLCGRQVSWAEALMAMDMDGPDGPGREEAA